MKNKLIVFEGIDGVGKTTLSRLLCKKLIENGIAAVRYEDIEEKGSGFNQIKDFVKTHVPIDASLLFYMASAIYKSGKIEDLLKHAWVICDRYVYSTLAYHTVRNASKPLIPDIKKIAIRLPDFLFLIKADDEIRLKRTKSRPGSTAYDSKIKTKRNLVGKMEKEIERFDPIIIDNSYSAPADVVEKIYTIVRKSTRKPG